MSGIQAQLMYDECATVQAIGQSTELFKNYDFLLPFFENTKKTNTLATCDGKYAHIECNTCKANNGLMENSLANLSYRINTENDLYGITRLNTKCDSLKFKPCYVKDNEIKASQKGTRPQNSACSAYLPIAQPLLCDRSVVPTNMKPFVNGFTYK